MNSSPRSAMRTFFSLALLFTLVPIAHADTTTGLVGWWKLDEGSGATVPDASGNNNTGTITGTPTWGTYHGRKCMIFSGGHRIYVSDSASLTSDTLTLAAWVDAPSNPGNGAVIDRAGYVPGWTSMSCALAVQHGTSVVVDGQTHYLLDAVGANTSNVTQDNRSVSGMMAPNRWHHLVFVAGAAGTKLYQDGVLLSSSTGTTLKIGNGQGLHIGFKETNGAYFSGAIRDARVYNRELTAADAAQLFNTEAQPAPRSLYTFDDNSLQDTSGNGFNATAATAPRYTLGTIGNGITLSGSANAIDAGPDVRMEQASVMAFVRVDEALNSTVSQSVVSSWTADPNFNLAWARDGTGKNVFIARFRKRQDATHAYAEQTVTSQTSFQPGVFHHVAMTYDGTTLRLFVNGREEAANSTLTGLAVTPAAPAANVEIGGISEGPSTIAWSVDDVRLYDHALGAAELAPLSSGVRGRSVYFEDFQVPSPDSIHDTWETLTSVSPNPGTATRPTRLLGPHHNISGKLKLPLLPSHTAVTVAYDLYLHGEWKGGGPPSATEDRFWSGLANGNFTTPDATTFNATFSTTAGTLQQFPSSGSTFANQPFTGAYETNTLGYGSDQVIRVVKTFPHTSSALALQLRREYPLNNTAGYWSLDNVSVSVSQDTPSAADFSLSGTITGTDLPAGSIRVDATSGIATDKLVLAQAGAYAFPRLNGPQTYRVLAYIDTDGDGNRDPFEWVGYGEEGSLYLDANRTTNIVIAAPVDSDNDGLSDEWEVENGLIVGTKDAALDKDSDGLTNTQEYWLGTNVSVNDSDGDGQTDGQEWLLGMNPLSLDSDGDGMPDAWEIANGLDPRRNDTAEDRDFDFITNLAEFTNGTNPDSADSDNDGVSDYEELNGKTNWLAIYDKNNRLIGQRFDNGASLFYGYDANSNPVRQVLSDSPDKDRDGVLDIWELANGLNPALQSDGYADSDGDGVTNYEEYIAGTDPQSSVSSTTSPGTLSGPITLPFTPTAFAVATGQIDGTGPEEVVVGGDGDPGATTNSIRIFSLNGGTWTAESVDVGAVGVTSIAIGIGNPAPIFVGTRAVSPGQGSVLKITKTGGIWSSSVLLTSLDEVAFAACVQSAGSLVAQFTSASGGTQKLHNINTSTGVGGYYGVDTGLMNLAPYYARTNGADIAVVLQTVTNPTANMAALGLGSVQNITTDPYSTMVLPSMVPYYTAAKLRTGLSSSPAVVQIKTEDTNASGTIDSEDRMFVIESHPGDRTDSPVLATTAILLFNPVSAIGSVASIRPASLSNRDAVIVGDADGNVTVMEATANSGPLRKHHLTSAHRGKAWHQFKSWRSTAETGDGAVGVIVSPSAPATAELVSWSPASLAANLASVPTQTAPRARIASTPNAGTAQASVPVDVWDTEGNPSRIALQYRLNPWSSWQNSTVTQIDTGSPEQSFAASPDGSRHTLAWNALADIGPSFRGQILLRTRAADSAEVGAWSEQSAYFISTLTPYETWAEDIALLFGADASETADIDLDGLTNLMEYATGSDPHASNAAGISASRSIAGIDFVYVRNKSATDVIYTVEWSDDLSTPSWTTTGVSAPTVLSDNGTTQQIKVTVPVENGVSRRFVRLRVTKP